MTEAEQYAFDSLYAAVEVARSALEVANAGAPEQDEDLRVACARLDNWLCENVGRWTVREPAPLRIVGGA
jgi:hypothetical protein